MWRKTPLSYTSEDRDERTCIYRLAGNLFGSSEGYAFQEDVRKKMAGGARRVVLDLARVDRIDSSGVGILVAVMWSASNSGGALVLACVPDVVERVLGITMLLPHVSRVDSVEDAV
jgi:anti-anti-sigma factor